MIQRTLVAMFLLSAWMGTRTTSVADEMRFGLKTKNGWYVRAGRVVWGYAQHNGWWRAGQRPNITRNAPGQIGPNRTEDLAKLTDAMLRIGYPGFEHNFGLWYDRRPDAHDVARRADGKAVAPFLEQPWARSGKGRAWDGLTQYDLTRYNDWYFQRLKQFADLCDREGAILLHNGYMQHALLETNAHYVDFPWRPTNCIQATDLPDSNPVANVFYDVSHPLRRKLHRAYIRKCLDVLGSNSNVVFLCSEEYTGPRSFMQFWLDTVFAWERETGCDVHVGLSATKDVLDAILSDPANADRISTIDLRYWWYRPDGSLMAPPGGQQVAGRYTHEIERTTPEQIHRQVTQYRTKYPRKVLLHGNPGTRQHAWAALTGGVSLLVGQLPYPEKKDPRAYIAPELCRAIQPTYGFVRECLATKLPQMVPDDRLVKTDKPVWCLADANQCYVVYALRGDQFPLDLSAARGSFTAKWFNPRTGDFAKTVDSPVHGGGLIRFVPPDNNDWVLWVTK